MFNSAQDDDRKVLEFFEQHLKPSDLKSLSELAGFEEPNDFPVSCFLDPLKEKQYPSHDHGEFIWIMDESKCVLGKKEFDSYEELPKALQFYLSSLYIFCNKIHCGQYLDGDFYYLIIRSELTSEISPFSHYYLLFMEWLYEWVAGQEYYDDYYFLLTWLLLRRLRQDGQQEVFEEVMNALEKKRYSQQTIELLGVRAKGVEAWLALNHQIPGLHGYTPEDFDPLIRGFE